MNAKLPIVLRALFGIGLMLFFAGGLSIQSVQSADPLSPSVDPYLTLSKTVTKDNGGTASETDFQAKIDGTDVDWDTPVQLPIGSYTASEVPSVSGYSPSIWTGDCAENGTITLADGESKTCYITNDDIPPSLTLTKIVEINYGGTAVPADWTLTATGPTPISGPGGAVSGSNFVAGTYTLSESPGPTGYTSGSWSCTGDGLQVDNQIMLGINESATCTITSSDIAPILTVVKNPISDSGFSALPDDFNLTVDGNPVTSGDPNPYNANTPLAINETLVEGYRFESITGDPKCPAVLGGTITMTPGDVITCTITNNDIGVNIDPTSGLQTSEDGVPTAIFDVWLDAPPLDDVILNLSSSNENEGTIDKPVLTFTTSDWSTAQTVTITGVDDFIADGNIDYQIITDSISSTGDPDYDALDPATDIPVVNVTNADNDTPGISTSPNTDLWTSEGGKTEQISVLLQSRPTSPVLLNVVSSNTNEGTIDNSTFTINPTPWPPAAPEVFTVTGVDDCKPGGDTFKVTITATSEGDPIYDGMSKELLFTNYDAPTIEWVKPVKTSEIFISDGFTPIPLEVKNSCGEPISKVRFYRWVVSLNDHLTIGEDSTAPYQEVLNPQDLESGWNQVFAYAFSPPNPKQTFSKHVQILILKDYDNLIYLPVINK